MGKKVLLADDSITIQKLVEMAFADTDFILVSVSDGQQAVDRLAEVSPDIILADAIMPHLDGYEVCRYVKSKPEYAQIPVVLLTGRFQPFDQAKAEEVHIDGRVVKPFVQEQLVDLINRLTGKGDSAPVEDAEADAAGRSEEPAVVDAFEDDDHDETLMLDSSMSFESEADQEVTHGDRPNEYDSHSTIRVNPDELQAYLRDKQAAEAEAAAAGDVGDSLDDVDLDDVGIEDLDQIEDLEQVDELAELGVQELEDADVLEVDELEEVEEEPPTDNSFDRSIEDLELDELSELKDDNDVMDLDDAEILDDEIEEVAPETEMSWDETPVSETIEPEVSSYDEPVEDLAEPESVGFEAMDLNDSLSDEIDDELDDFELEDIDEFDSSGPSDEVQLYEKDTVPVADFDSDSSGDDLLDVEELPRSDQAFELEAELNEDTPVTQMGSDVATQPLQSRGDVDFDTGPQAPVEVPADTDQLEPIPDEFIEEPDFEIPTEELEELGEEDLITEPTDVDPDQSSPEFTSVVGEDTLPGKNILGTEDELQSDEFEPTGELELAEVDTGSLETPAPHSDEDRAFEAEFGIKDIEETPAINIDESAGEESGLAGGADELELDTALVEDSFDDGGEELDVPDIAELGQPEEPEKLSESPTFEPEPAEVSSDETFELGEEEPELLDEFIELADLPESDSDFTEVDEPMEPLEVTELLDEPLDVVDEVPAEELELDVSMSDLPTPDEDSLGELLDVEQIADETSDVQEHLETPPPLPVSGAVTLSSLQMDEVVTRVAEQVIAKLSDGVLHEIAWEIIPELAEAMINKRIFELEKAAEE